MQFVLICHRSASVVGNTNTEKAGKPSPQSGFRSDGDRVAD
ncbi:MAG: hypothetical protein AB4290_29040 [Spirulina sp.]